MLNHVIWQHDMQKSINSRASGNFMLNIRMGKKFHLSHFARGMVVGARWPVSSVSGTAGLLGFSRLIISRVYTQDGEKNKNMPRAVNLLLETAS